MSELQRAILQSGAFTRQQADILAKLLDGTFSAADAAKLASIEAGATVGADWASNLANIPANVSGWAGLDPAETLPKYVNDQGYIGGFGHITSPTSVEVDAGMAYVPGAGGMVAYAGGTVSGTIPNATTLHLYLHSNGTVSASATAPAAPYVGTARHMAGNTSTRYLFSVRSRNSGNALYLQRGEAASSTVDVNFLHNAGVDGILTNTLGSTTPIDMDCSPWAPGGPTSIAKIRALNNGSTSGNVRLYCYTGAGFAPYVNAPMGVGYWVDVPCDDVPRFQADVTGAGVSGAIWITGYRILR